MPLHHFMRSLAASSLLVTSACAGATMGSGVGDRLLEHPPWYAGSPPPAGAQLRYLPVAYQRGGSQAEMFDPDAESEPVAVLLRDINRYLDSLGVGRPLEAAAPGGTPPDVHFGCETDVTGDCVEPDGAIGQVGDPVM